MQNPQLGRLVIDPEYEVGCIYSEGRRIIEGYLRKMKQGGKKMFGKTTKRWFILNLNRGIFGYKEKEKASVLKGAFDLRVTRSVIVGPRVHSGRPVSRDQEVRRWVLFWRVFQRPLILIHSRDQTGAANVDARLHIHQN